MTKQNFISMSLESGLKYVDLLCEPDDNICTLKGILNGLYCDEHGNVDCEINDCMPILRPLDLTKEIEHGGEKFVPIVELAKISGLSPRKISAVSNNKVICDAKGWRSFSEFSFNNNSFNIANFRHGDLLYMNWNIDQMMLFQELIYWHFDIYNLISKNQAIDINTLETNPYK